MEVDLGGNDPANPFSRKIFSPMINITIGNCAHVYRAHHQQLVSCSLYFKGCLGAKPGGSPMIEGQTMTVHLDDIGEEYYDAFEAIIMFAYEDEFRLEDEVNIFRQCVPTNAFEEDVLRKRCARDITEYAKVYVLAERLLCEELKRNCISAIGHIFKLARKYPYPDQLLEAERHNSRIPFAEPSSEPYHYRLWCEDRESPTSFKNPKTTTLLRAEDILDAIKIVYENTPKRGVDPQGEYKDLRSLLTTYCVTFSKEFYNSERFRIFLSENRDFSEEFTAWAIHALPQQGWYVI